MSKYRRPRGRLIQTTPDWFIDRMMGGSYNQALNAASNSFIELYNDANDGSVLHVWSLHIWAQSATTQGNCFLYAGTQGALIANDTFALNPIAPNRFGKIYAGNGSIGLQNKIYTMSGNNTPTDWYQVWPFCTLPPGWGLLVATGVVNVALSAGFMWCSMSPMEGMY